MALDDYTPNENPGGDNCKPSEVADHLLVVKILQRKDGIVTQYKPDGGPGVIVNVADLDDGATYRDVLWMNGALVDNLTPNVGKTIAVRLVWQTGASGRAYITIAAASDDDKAKAGQFLTDNPDPWAYLDEPAQVKELVGAGAPVTTVGAAPSLTAEQVEGLRKLGIEAPPF